MSDDLRLIDLHAHFPMHLPFPPRKTGDDKADRRNGKLLWVANRAANFDKGRPRVTIEQARDGCVGALASVLYNPADECCIPREPFKNLCAQMVQVEKEVAKDKHVRVVRNPGELEKTLKDPKKLALIHCVEGGFAVEDPCNVAELAKRGVAYIILAHLFFRDVATCVNAFPCLDDRTFAYYFRQPDCGLTKLGVQICTEMFKNGIIVDITHASEAAIDDIFRIAEGWQGRPVIASHAGVRCTSSQEYLLNLSDETILRIKHTGGIVGVILFDHWLRPPNSDDNGIHLVLDAIDHIRKVTGSFDYVGIGTDFDGFIKPVDGLAHMGKLRDLRKRLVKKYGHECAEKIMWRNALGVLKRGWGTGC